MTKKSNRAAIFARYSSNLQSDLSLEAQVTEMERYCEREGLTITHRFLLPETRSALVERSDEFQDMVKAAKRQEFDCLVVHKIDRFTRDRDTAVAYKALLRRHKVAFRSVTENLGESIYDRMIEGFLEVIAEFYSLNLAAETKKGQRAAIRAGRWTGGKPPYGYVRESADGGTVLGEHPQEAPIIRAVFEMYANGHGTEEILQYTETVTGKRWRYPTLQSRLKNPTYIGRLEYGKTSLDAKGNRTVNDPDDVTTGECLALISQDIWDATRQRMGTASSRNAKKVYDYLLSEGVMVCAHCGRNAIGECRGRDHLPYYRCSGWRDKLCPVKKRTSVRADKLEPIFIERLREKIIPRLDAKKCMDAVTALEQSRQKFAQDEERAIHAELREVSQQKDNLLEFVMGGGGKGQVESINRKLKELEEKEAVLGENLATVRLKMEQRAKEVTEAVHSWFMRMVSYLDNHHTSHEWKSAVKAIFRLEWDWEKKEGTIGMMPFFAENPELTGLGSPGRDEKIRSTQI